jgi:CRP/FNR family transcriptional regulator, anaerobic regulatory protein
MIRGQLIEFLENMTELTEDDKSLIFQYTEEKRANKGDFLLEFGQTCTELHFVLSGVIRFYILNDKGEELTTVFIGESEIATRLESFLRGVPSNGYLQCETPCHLITISKQNWNIIAEKSSNISIAMANLATIYLSKKLEIQRRLLTSDARSAYLEFMKFHCDLAERIPMKHISSYLGITPSSLSRIKKEITES